MGSFLVSSALRENEGRGGGNTSGFRQESTSGVGQGCLLFPFLLLLVMDCIMKETTKDPSKRNPKVTV